MMQIPIYRSLELDTACEIVGFYVKENGFYRVNGEDDVERPVVRHYIFGEYGERYEISPEYLSINFENMIDKNGKKIFASLSDDGAGGDIISLKGQFGIKFYSFKHENMYPAKITSSGTILIDGISMPTCQIFVDINKNNVFEITGIHKAQPTTTQKE